MIWKLPLIALRTDVAGFRSGVPEAELTNANDVATNAGAEIAHFIALSPRLTSGRSAALLWRLRFPSASGLALTAHRRDAAGATAERTIASATVADEIQSPGPQLFNGRSGPSARQLDESVSPAKQVLDALGVFDAGDFTSTVVREVHVAPFLCLVTPHEGEMAAVARPDGVVR
jgi:hypothetical protein